MYLIIVLKIEFKYNYCNLKERFLGHRFYWYDFKITNLNKDKTVNFTTSTTPIL